VSDQDDGWRHFDRGSQRADRWLLETQKYQKVDFAQNGNNEL